MGLVNVKSKKSRIKYTGDFPNGMWTKFEQDENNNLIYREESDGTWRKWKYDKNGAIQSIQYPNEIITIKYKRRNKNGIPTITTATLINNT